MMNCYSSKRTSYCNSTNKTSYNYLKNLTNKTMSNLTKTMNCNLTSKKS